MYLVGAGSILGLTWWLDRRGYRGTATGLCAAGLTAALIGTVLLGNEFGDTSGPLLVLVVGIVICIVGTHGERRATTWWGAALAAIGIVSLVPSRWSRLQLGQRRRRHHLRPRARRDRSAVRAHPRSHPQATGRQRKHGGDGTPPDHSAFAPPNRSSRSGCEVPSRHALGIVHFVVRGTGRPAVDRRSGGRRGRVRVGRACSSGTISGTRRWFRSPTRSSRWRHRDGDRAGADRHDGHRPAERRPQLVAQATTSLDRLSNGRMVLGLGLGVDSYGEYSVFDEPATDDRAVPRCSTRGSVAQANARRRAGRQRRRQGDHPARRAAAACPDLDCRPGQRSPPARGEFAATGWRVWRWWTAAPGRPNTSRPHWPPAT